jgi:hypothetical protein
VRAHTCTHTHTHTHTTHTRTSKLSPAPPYPRPLSYNGAGAVWDILRREDVPALCGWLRAHAAEFTHEGEGVAGYLGAGPDAEAPVLSQRFMLVDRHRRVGALACWGRGGIVALDQCGLTLGVQSRLSSECVGCAHPLPVEGPHGYVLGGSRKVVGLS